MRRFLSLSYRLVLPIVLMGIFATSFAQQEYLQSRYYKIARQNLKAFTWEDIDWSDNFNEFLHQCLDMLQKGQPFQKRKQGFELLGGLKAQCHIDYSVMDPTTWSDLQLFCDNDGSDAYLGAIVDRAITELGKVQLLHMIGEPITDISLLKKRQKIIKTLLENEALFKELKNILQCLREHENKIFSFWYQRDSFWQTAQRYYWSLPFLERLNNSWQLLELKNRFGHHARIFFLVTSIIAAGVLTTHGTLTLLGISKHPFFKKLEKFKEYFEGSGGELGPVISFAKLFSSFPLYHGALNILAGLFCGLSIKEQVEWERDLLFLDECLQIKLIGVRKYLHSVTRLIAIVKKNAVLFDSLTDVQNFCNFFQNQANSKYQEILAVLSASTFQGDPSIFSSKGKVLQAYKLLRENKEIFLSLLTVLAEVDAYYAIAQLYKEFEKERVSYSFAEYLDAEKPYLALEEFWNPFVDAKKVVTNSLVLGGEHCQNGIITGPNTGGKSCNLKACAICLILGQSFGIVPAKKAIFTPFSKIMTHLNITDDIAAGNSLFKAEVLRAQTILKTIKQCKQREFCFVIMDELFNGTTPREGQAAAFGYAKFIGSYANTIALIATHFAQLTELAQITNYFQNYAVSVKYKDNGEIVCTFKLEPGISNQHIAFDILRNEGIDQEILDDAHAILG